MKAKELIYGLGVRPRAREYPFEIRQYTLPGFGAVDFAQWRHPSALRAPSIPDMKEVEGLRRLLGPGDIAIDIGAHSGDSTLPIALAVGATGMVLAFEPNRYAFHVLAANAGLNRRLTNIHPYMFAATPDDGPMTFEYSDAGFCNGGRHEGISRWRHAHFFPLGVEGRDLAKFIGAAYPAALSRVRFVKIDTEGYDHVVFRSLRALIRRSRPAIRTEIFRHMPHEARVAYVADLVSEGYDVRRMESGHDYVGVPLAAAEVSQWGHFDLLALPA